MSQNSSHQIGSLRVHELIDDLDQCRVPHCCVANSADEFEAVKIMRSALKDMPNAVKFFIDDAVELEPIKDLFKLPFDTCWFELQDVLDANPVSEEELIRLCMPGHWKPNTEPRYFRHGVLAKNDGAGVVLTIFTKPTDKKWTFIGEVRVRDTSDPDTLDMWIRDSGFAGFPPATDGWVSLHESAYRPTFFKLAAALSAINCSNVSRIETVAPPKLNAARARRGKPPLYSFYTLQLGHARAGSHGGSGQRGPGVRLHLRRGHPRQYRPGEWTWVQPHVVGDKKLGMVAKDYALAGA